MRTEHLRTKFTLACEELRDQWVAGHSWIPECQQWGHLAVGKKVFAFKTIRTMIYKYNSMNFHLYSAPKTCHLGYLFGINSEEEQLSASVIFLVKTSWVNKDIARCELCCQSNALCCCALKVISCCLNLSWVSLSVIDVFCVKHAQSVFLTRLCLFQVEFWQAWFQTGWRRGHQPAEWCYCLQHPQ